MVVGPGAATTGGEVGCGVTGAEETGFGGTDTGEGVGDGATTAASAAEAVYTFSELIVQYASAKASGLFCT